MNSPGYCFFLPPTSLWMKHWTAFYQLNAPNVHTSWSLQIVLLLGRIGKIVKLQNMQIKQCARNMPADNSKSVCRYRWLYYMYNVQLIKRWKVNLNFQWAAWQTEAHFIRQEHLILLGCVIANWKGCVWPHVRSWKWMTCASAEWEVCDWTNCCKANHGGQREFRRKKLQ